MPTLSSPLTLAQIRQQTVDLLGHVMAEQSFMPDQIDEAVNWACDELARTLGMTYVPQTRCFLQSGDLRRPVLPDASVKVVQASLLPETGTTVQVPNCANPVAVMASLNTALYGDTCEVLASDGVASMFMARHSGGVFGSQNPHGWVIVKSDKNGVAPQIVAGILGPNNPYASPPTSDPAYTAPVDGVAGTSTVMDVLSMAVSPDGNSVAWFEGSTNRLRVATLAAGVWTTRTVAGAYNTYRVDGTGPAAGFSAGLSPLGDTHYGSYEPRFTASTGFGIAWADATHIVMAETPLEAAFYAGAPDTLRAPSRLLLINVSTGVVQTMATDIIPVNLPRQGNGYPIFSGGWLRPVVLPGTDSIQGCRIVLIRHYPGFIPTNSDDRSDVAPFSDSWPPYTAMDGMQSASPLTSGPIINLAVTGRTRSCPGAKPFDGFVGAIALDVSPLGLYVCVPRSVINVTATDANGNSVFYPAPADYGTIPVKSLAAGPNAASFPDHMASFNNGDWALPNAPGAFYQQNPNHSCWLGGTLFVLTAGNLIYSCGGA